MQESSTYPSQEEQSAAPFLVGKDEAPVYQADPADSQDGVCAQAILLARLYGESALWMCIRALSVVMSLGASCVMYYYIGARGKHGLTFWWQHFSSLTAPPKMIN